MPELLSPVGSFESLRAAIDGGADAIYFGTEQLNMRAKSINSFSLEEMEAVAQICKTHGVSAYLTLNTVMYDHDMQLIKTVLRRVKECGVDAVIASDFAVMERCREMQIPLHISTQANVSNVETVRFFAQFADVIVLARELSLRQIDHIAREIKRQDIRGVSGERMRLEVFVHGALCMAVSGKCYLSLHEQNASANRGACTQNCRRPYAVRDLETGNELVVDNEYIMSPKDLCTLSFLDEVIRSGADVLKIEGRGKSADYVYTTTQCYRQAIDAVASGTFAADKVKGWMEELSKVYHRGFWEGYYLGRKLGAWTTSPGSAALERKVYVGKGSNYFSKIAVAEFEIEAGALAKGDTIMVIGRNTGVLKLSLEEMVVNGEYASSARKGDLLTLPIGRKVLKTDKLYKLVTNDA